MNPKPLSSLNHFTVPVAILIPPGYVRCETRRVQRGNNCENAGHRFGRTNVDRYEDSSANPRDHRLHRTCLPPISPRDGRVVGHAGKHKRHRDSSTLSFQDEALAPDAGCPPVRGFRGYGGPAPDGLVRRVACARRGAGTSATAHTTRMNASRRVTIIGGSLPSGSPNSTIPPMMPTMVAAEVVAAMTPTGFPICRLLAVAKNAAIAARMPRKLDGPTRPSIPWEPPVAALIEMSETPKKIPPASPSSRPCRSRIRSRRDPAAQPRPSATAPTSNAAIARVP